MEKPLKLIASWQYRYSSSLHGSYHDMLYNALLTEGEERLTRWRVAEFLTPWRQSIDVEIDVTREAKASSLTDKIRQLDKLRDSILSYLFSIIRTEEKHGLRPQRKEAGRRLSIAMRPYRGMQKLGYREQSATLLGLLTDLRKEHNLNALRTLGLDEYLADLELANTELAQQMAQRTEQRVETKLPTSLAQRRISDELLSAILQRLHGAFFFADTDEERKLLNDLFARFNSITTTHCARYNQTQAKKQ